MTLHGERLANQINSLMGIFFGLYITAGQYKAALPFLPDMTIVMLALSLFCAVWWVLLTGRLPRMAAVGICLWIGISVFALFTTLINPYWPGSEVKLARLLVIDGWAFIGGCLMAQDRKAVRSFLLTLLVVAVGISATAVFQFGQQLGTRTINLEFVDYLGISRLSAMGAIMAFWQFQASPVLVRRLWWLLLMIGLLIIGSISGGRGPTVAVALVLSVNLFFAWSATRDPGKRARVFMLLLVLAVAVVVAGNLGLFQTAIDRFIIESATEDSVLGRLSRLTAGLDLWAQSPFLGRGANAFPAYFMTGLLDDTPHNLVVELGAEFGLVPLALISGSYLWVLGKTLGRVLRRQAYDLTVSWTVFSLALFWLIQVPLISIQSGKFGAVFHGIGLGLLGLAGVTRQAQSQRNGLMKGL